MSFLHSLRKAARYCRLYGLRRTWAKIQAKRHHAQRAKWPTRRVAKNDRQYVGIVGCGNFAYSCIAYYLRRDHGLIIRGTMDIDERRAAVLRNRYGATYYSTDARRILSDPDISCLFIASNHATHADYAIRALRVGKSVHVEKPVAVTRGQLSGLCEAMNGSSARLTTGYNRPNSRLGRRALAELGRESGPSAQSWFIAGHKIPPDHWYSLPTEGGRVLGNLCHWIDFSLRTVPEHALLPITITPTLGAVGALQVCYSFGDGSTASLTLSSTTEPFEGVRERYTAQRGQVLIALDDFETLTIVRGARRRRLKNVFRDHGHRATVRRSLDAASQKIPGDSPDYVWKTGMLAIWTRDSVEERMPLAIDSWYDSPRRLILSGRAVV